MKRKVPNLDKPYSKHRPVSDAERLAWQVTMGETTQPAAPSEPIPEKPIQQKIAPPIKASVKKKAVPLPHDWLEKAMRAKITRTKMKAQATLDLHGYTREMAYNALISHVNEWRRLDIRLALIITGKGKGGPGTLRTLLPQWLNESPLREHIIAYDNASPRHGGEGAWYVRIRKRK